MIRRAFCALCRYSPDREGEEEGEREQHGTMGNQGSFMEKVYLYLPVLLCHSNMDYNDKTTMWNIRAAYFAEQVSRGLIHHRHSVF